MRALKTMLCDGQRSKIGLAKLTISRHDEESQNYLQTNDSTMMKTRPRLGRVKLTISML